MEEIEKLHEAAAGYIQLNNKIEEKIKLLSGFSQQWDALHNFKRKQEQDQIIEAWKQKQKAVKKMYFSKLKNILDHENK